MSEQTIIDLLILNAFNYHKFGDERYKQSYTNWMYELKRIKRFNTLEETANYFLSEGWKRDKVTQ